MSHIFIARRRLPGSGCVSNTLKLEIESRLDVIFLEGSLNYAAIEMLDHYCEQVSRLEIFRLLCSMLFSRYNNKAKPGFT